MFGVAQEVERSRNNLNCFEVETNHNVLHR